MKINENYFSLKDSYLFSTISRKVGEFKKANPLAELFYLGIGDFTLPLSPAVTNAMSAAVLEMSREDTYHGYGPEQGYDFLQMSIQDYYKQKGVLLDTDEIFVSDGAKSDLANIMDIFDPSCTVMMPDPVYPAYLDVNLMLGRKVQFLVGNKENNFKPAPPEGKKADIIYICSPNNPTGSVYTKEELKTWVDFAKENNSVILFDAAYESYIQDETLPTSIYQIEGAKDCAIEICSLSKTAGFTGTRCGYTIVPKDLADGVLNRFWNRRQTTKFNGVAYVVQRGAQAVFTREGMYENKKNVDIYMKNANVLHKALSEAGIWHTGGENGPYIWFECPKGISSWEYFDILLNAAHVIGTPGAGFGKHGEGYFRLTCFGDNTRTKEAMERIANLTF
jgi:LL-diaminopimelate aminotransferase